MLEKGPAIEITENLEFLDTPIHIHIHVLTMHDYKIIMTVLVVSVGQIMVLPM